MATVNLFVFVLCTYFVHSQSFFDNLLHDTENCNRICSDTYPVHTYEQTQHALFCYRGCRLFNILGFLEEDSSNNTKEACDYACSDAYDDILDINACKLGCDSQKSATQQDPQSTVDLSNGIDDAVEQAVSPLFHARSFCYSMFDNMRQHVSYSWSMFVQSDDSSSSVVIVRSQPKYISFSQVPDRLQDSKTANYIEAFLPEVDNSATPNVKHSQMHPVDLSGSYDSVSSATIQEIPNDWLSCIAKKTGLPRLLLSLTIFASAMVMIWLCFTTAATAPEHRIHSTSKLSINGDLEYIKEMEKRSLMTHINPEDMIHQAAPLHVKIKVEEL